MSKGGSTGKTILVVDDDPEIVTMVSLRLGKRGYRVLTAVDGVQALAIARRDHPDLVILDVMMPGKNGWEVAKELRADPATKDISILVLTAIGQTMNDMNSPLYGADDYLDKPFEFEKLEPASNSSVRQKIKLVQGIPSEKAKIIVAAIKDSKKKAQASIQGDTVRVVSKDRDVLQEVMALLRAKDIGVELQFTNFRSN